MFIDTHAHMNLMDVCKQSGDFVADNRHEIGEIVSQAMISGVAVIINIGTEPQDSLVSTKMAQTFPNVFAVVGLHPCTSFVGWNEQVRQIRELVRYKEQNKIVGIGEIGFDFHHEPFYKEYQEASFRAQIELALDNALPIVVHVRKAADETLRVMEEYVKDGLTGVIHCFSQNHVFADQVLEWGFYIGIDGHITYPKNDELRSVIKNVPVSRLLLETDAPFLPPQRFRGKQNHPAFIPMIAEFIANLKEISLKEVEMQTTVNAKKLFKGLAVNC